MCVTGFDGDDVVSGVDGFHAEHLRPFVIRHVRQGFTLVDPWVPDHGGIGTLLGDADLAVFRFVDNHARCLGVAEHAVEFTGEMQWAIGGMRVDACDFVQVGASFQTDDLNIVNVADTKVAVQGFGDFQFFVIGVLGLQRHA